MQRNIIVRIVKTFCVCAAVFLTLMAGAGVAHAENDTIRAVQVIGNQRVEEASIRSYLALNEGDAFDAEKVDDSLKRLFATKLFSDIRIRREGDALVVQVTENPIINRIAFEGNKKLTDEALNNEVQLRPRFVYTRAKVTEDTNRLLDVYRRSGRFSVKITPKIITLDQNRVDLVYEINEGPVTSVRRIVFVGNHKFSDGTLRATVQTKENSFFSVLSSSDTYDPDRLNFDKEVLRRFYLKEGYADFEVTSVVAELLPDKSGFFVTFTVNEGKRYRVSDIQINSSVKDVNVEDLSKEFLLAKGEWYDAEKVESTIDQITDKLGNLGYAFVEVEPRISKDPQSQSLAIAFDLNEGPKVYVERIDIEGNVRTMDEVVRREFELGEGDAFNTSKLRLTRRHLNNLGYFEKVDVNTEPGSEPDRTIIKTRVAEQSTGELSLGAGFSTSDALLGNIKLRERNLLGKGQDIRVQGIVSGRRSEIDLGFTEPYFMDRRLAAGFDIFKIRREPRRDATYVEGRSGASLRLGYDINPDLSQRLKYTYENVSIEDVDPEASRFIRDQQGTRKTSEVSQALTYDVRDNRFDPSNGYFLRAETAFAGPGGDVTYLKGEFSGGVYTPLADEWILSFEGRAGLVQGLGDDDVNIGDRFFIGGRTFRGFKQAGVGPRDRVSEDPLGGNQYYVGTVELTFPTPLPEDLGVRGSIFTDVGSITKIDDNDPDVLDTGALRASVGVGLSWRSPFGPIRIDLAHAVMKEEYDETEIINFDFGTSF